MPGDGGRKRGRREKVEKGKKMRRRRKRDVELFSKCKELVVTICSCYEENEEEMLALSFHVWCVSEGFLIVVFPNWIMVIFRLQSVNYIEGWCRIECLTVFN